MVPMTIEQWEQRVRDQYGEFAEEFHKIYPAESDEQVQSAFLASVRDGWFSCQMQSWAELTSTAAEAYLYYFTRVPPIANSAQYGAYHGAEHIYIVGNLHLAPFTPELVDRRLSEDMMSYWVNFARTGNPNDPSLVKWPAYETETQYYMEFGDEIRVSRQLLPRECAFFSRYQASRKR
jgi:para-nitrobenzyl esterase